jgi:hypothetical protein
LITFGALANKFYNHYSLCMVWQCKNKPLP